MYTHEKILVFAIELMESSKMTKEEIMGEMFQAGFVISELTQKELPKYCEEIKLKDVF